MKKFLVSMLAALLVVCMIVPAVAEGVVLGQSIFAAHGTKCFAVITVAMDGDKIAAATIEGSNIKAGTISASHVTADFGKSLDLTSNVGINQRVEAIYTDMDTLIGYRLEVVSTADVLSAAVKNTTLTARVWHGSEDVTASIPAARFRWIRTTEDATADQLWNASHAGVKSIQLSVTDVLYSATYQCELSDT